VYFHIIGGMPGNQTEQFAVSIASEAVEVLEDHLLFPGGYLLPLSARGGGVPGMPDRPWSRLTADVFFPNLPVMYSLAPPSRAAGCAARFFAHTSHAVRRFDDGDGREDRTQTLHG
jgi:hypothetical protein